MSDAARWNNEHECRLSTKHICTFSIVCLFWSQRKYVWRALCIEHIVLVADFKLSNCELQPNLSI